MHTLHLEVIGLGNVEQIITLSDLEIVLFAVFIDNGHIDPA